ATSAHNTLSLHDALPIYLASAETERDDAEQRIGQPFRHAQALADAEKDLARIETQLAAMQEDIDHAAQPEPAPENPPNGLNVERSEEHTSELQSREKIVC